MTTVAYAVRFLRKIVGKIKPQLREKLQKSLSELKLRSNTTYISSVERKAALNIIIRNHQQPHVTTQFRKSVKDLNLNYDEHKILRCFGRLNRAHLPELTKKPYFIQAKTPLAECLLKDAHYPLHLSTSHTMAKVREKF